ncbi:depupylase/deamidase Dop [Bifidobacterium cuniculi]|uniref:Proteasome-associated protein n=1 Tax=Bifidobacterium cuniculi TaxID=1688 RepID=A0A087AX37_9BIFI|nr:depupylase/deamidase Dop [Bifidobacterium cuniculi]KFI63337.1 proteasome-associated protein [Bifidobacterium cuniculi]
MSVRRIMGTETEYGVQGAPGGNPVQWSFDVVAAASTPATAHIRWDYAPEDPVNDLRGMRLPRANARTDMLTDAPQAQVTNVLAPNGGRIYVDHAHPEYSAPETRDPFDAVAYDSAGDLLMMQAVRGMQEGKDRVRLYRTNVDGKGASWGTHENYLMDRAVPFDPLSQVLMTHFATRQTYAGAGRVGLGERSERPGYQLSQRADYFHMKVGLQTTFDRPIVNTRDEPHAPEAYRRLHVIVGDANRMDVPRVLKLGTTSMVLWLCEHAEQAGMDLGSIVRQVVLDDPVAAMHEVSHDLTLSTSLALADGTAATAWQLQVRLMSLVHEAAAVIHGTDTRGEPQWPDRATRSVMAMWRQALVDVATIRHTPRDRWHGLANEAGRVEWLLKWQVLDRLRRRKMADKPMEQACADPRMQAVDLAWADLDPATSLFTRLAARTERTSSEGDVAQASVDAPVDTRAWLRGQAIGRFAPQVHAVSWTRITTEPDSRGRRWLLDMDDPLRWTEPECAEAVAQAADLWHLVRALGGVPR